MAEERTAKDQSVRVGGDPENGSKDNCSKAHARTTEDKEDFSGGGDIEERAKLMKEGPAQRICSTHLKTGSNNNSERRNLGCEIIVSYVCIGNQIFHIELMMS